jgi:enamine deaminase RidA (YjgF/YER057c/UK114 family)
VSGQLPITPDGTKLNDSPFAVQVGQTLANVEGVHAVRGFAHPEVAKSRAA